MHAVAGEHLEAVQHLLAVAPGVHEQRLEAHLVGGHAQPQQVAVHALEFAEQRAYREGALRGLGLGYLLDVGDIAGGVGMRADAADALYQVEILYIGTVLGGLLHAAVVVAEVHGGAGDLLAVQDEHEVLGLFERGVLGAQRDGYL